MQAIIIRLVASTKGRQRLSLNNYHSFLKMAVREFTCAIELSSLFPTLTAYAFLQELNSKTLPTLVSSPNLPTRRQLSFHFCHTRPLTVLVLQVLFNRTRIILQLLLGIRGRTTGCHSRDPHYHRRYPNRRSFDRR